MRKVIENEIRPLSRRRRISLKNPCLTARIFLASVADLDATVYYVIKNYEVFSDACPDGHMMCCSGGAT